LSRREAPRSATRHCPTRASPGPTTGISLGHIGVGNRGAELDGIVALLKGGKNAEVTAVCDLWTNNLERAVAANQKYYGKAPRALRHPQELLALKDVDAVMISTPEHSHSPLLRMTAEAGRMLTARSPWQCSRRSESDARCGPCSESHRSDWHQHRSEAYQIAVRD